MYIAHRFLVFCCHYIFLHTYVCIDKPEASNIHLLSRPEHMIPKCTSFSSVDSDQSEGSARSGVLSRAGTMSEGPPYRKDINRSHPRPKSEITPGSMHKELEASFEVSVTDLLHTYCTTFC